MDCPYCQLCQSTVRRPTIDDPDLVKLNAVGEFWSSHFSCSLTTDSGMFTSKPSGLHDNDEDAYVHLYNADGLLLKVRRLRGEVHHSAVPFLAARPTAGTW